LEEWLEGKSPEKDVISPEARLNEIFAVNLRTTGGWTPGSWQQVPGCDSWGNRLALMEKISETLERKWFIISQERIALTGDGMMFWNSVAGEIFDYGA
jgi:coproporphyrinogen III oxidase-like Fe-S oxidoreductase